MKEFFVTNDEVTVEQNPLNPGKTVRSTATNKPISKEAFDLIKRLILSMLPRFAKSISYYIAFPAYLHGHDPTKEIIAVSYAQSLSAKF